MLREGYKYKNSWMKMELENSLSSCSDKWKVSTEVMRNPQGDIQQEEVVG